jgi:hypothetical protein
MGSSHLCIELLLMCIRRYDYDYGICRHAYRSSICMHTYWSSICMHDYKLLLRCDLYINMCIAHAKFFFLFHTREPLSTNRFSFKTSVTGQIVPAKLLISFRIYCSRYYCSATLLYSTNTDNSIDCLVSIWFRTQTCIWVEKGNSGRWGYKKVERRDGSKNGAITVKQW